MSTVLPIEDDPRFRIYTASAGQTQFAIKFPFQQAEDIILGLRGLNGEYQILPRTLYVITGAGVPEGGMATFHVGRTAGDIILVLGSAILDRLSSIVRDGRFASRVTDDELDRNRIIQQELRRDLGQALKAPYGSTPPAIPGPDDHRVIGWRDGNLVNIDPGDFINDAGYATADQGEKADAALQPLTGMSRIDIAPATWADTSAKLAAINYTAYLHGALYTPRVTPLSDGNYNGIGPSKTRLIRTLIAEDVAGNVVANASRVNNVTIADMEIDLNRDNTKTTGGQLIDGHGISLSGNDITVKDATVRGFSSLYGGGGTGVLVFGTPEHKALRARLENLNLIGHTDAAAVNTLGWIIANADYSFVSHCYAENALGLATAFGHEVKNESHYNNYHALTTRYGLIGFGGGYDDPLKANGPKCNAGTGIISAATDVGILFGDTRYSSFGTTVHDASGSPGTQPKYAITLVDNNIGNVFSGAVSTGDVVASVRLRSGATRNAIDVATHVGTSKIAEILDAGTTRNYINVLHPGSYLTINGAYTDLSGNGLKGSAANVINCPITGERHGSISGRYWDKLAASGAAVLSSHKWVYEDDASIDLAGLTPTAQRFGFVHSTPARTATGWFAHVSNATATSEYWEARTGGVTVLRIGGGSVYPVADGTYNLGLAALRYGTVYAATGTINTSDAREKTEALSVDDAVLDAWGDVRILCYRWLDAIALKGELARIHHGVIAQQVRDAFVARGLDGRRYGLLCYDAWDAEPEVLDEDGNVTQAARPAGDRWGIRPDQCLWLEAAYQRRRCDRIEARLAALEAAAD